MNGWKTNHLNEFWVNFAKQPVRLLVSIFLYSDDFYSSLKEC